MGYIAQIWFRFAKDGVLNWFQDKARQLPQKAHGLVSEILDIFKEEADVRAPWLNGALVKAHQIFLGTLEGYLISTAAHFEYVILGTPAHSIGSPVWIVQVGWRYIGLSPAGRGKIHPGTKPNDYMLETFEAGMPEVDKRCENFLAWLAE